MLEDNISSQRSNERVLWLDEVGLKDIAKVGGKNASLGEMIGYLNKMGVRVPEGFAVTTEAFREFIDQNGLEERIKEALKDLDSDNPADVAERGKDIRKLFIDSEFPEEVRREVGYGYWELGR
jgi:pyruvate,water dikinase